MTRAFVLVAVLAGCGGDGSCDLEKVIADDFATIEGEDCGHIEIGDEAGLMAARTCVQTALTDSRPFRVIFEVQGIDSKIVRGYAADASMLYSYHYDGDPSGGSRTGATSSRSTCGSIVDLTTCDMQTLAQTLCLMCSNPTIDPASRCEE